MRRAVYTASHGGFEHVEKIVQTADGKWSLTYEYDSAATAMYALNPTRMYITLEFSSELASFDFDPHTGELHELDRISTVAAGFAGRNEPATLRVHPQGRFVYVNNRGEDTVITVIAGADGKLTRRHAFQLGKSMDPGIATRQLALTPDAKYLFVPERPAYAVRALAVQEDGTLTDVSSTPIDNPVYVCFAEL